MTMMKTNILASLVKLAAFCVPIISVTSLVNAQVPTVIHVQGKYQTQAPDWSKITWDTLPRVQQSGYLKIPQNLMTVLGYDPSREWSAEQKTDSIVMLGDIDDAFKTSFFTLEQLSEIVGANSKLTLKDM
jgi:hypothetical protein